MEADIVKILTSTDLKRRVVIMKRNDGHFSCVEQIWYQNVYEGKLVAEGWKWHPNSTSIFQSVEMAERAARMQFPWVD